MLAEIEEIVEIDDGFLMGVHILGHVEDDVAVPLAWSYLIERDYFAFGYLSKSLDRPIRTYVRKVPFRDDYGLAGWRFAYCSKPGRGARAVTRVEMARVRPIPCALCPWDSVVTAGHDQTPLCHKHAVETLQRALDGNALRRAEERP